MAFTHGEIVFKVPAGHESGGVIVSKHALQFVEQAIVDGYRLLDTPCATNQSS